MKKKSLLLPIFCLMTLQNLFAQVDASPDFFRATGKIYVVVGVIFIIFIGIILFLINLDRKLTRLEKRLNNDN
jgi:CcmD family protein